MLVMYVLTLLKVEGWILEDVSRMRKRSVSPFLFAEVYIFIRNLNHLHFGILK